MIQKQKLLAIKSGIMNLEAFKLFKIYKIWNIAVNLSSEIVSEDAYYVNISNFLMIYFLAPKLKSTVLW